MNGREMTAAELAEKRAELVAFADRLGVTPAMLELLEAVQAQLNRIERMLDDLVTHG